VPTVPTVEVAVEAPVPMEAAFLGGGFTGRGQGADRDGGRGDGDGQE
jgi:hypothetical protein